MSYKLICMSFDGDYVTEDNRGDNFETIADAWEFGNDMGSRWFFYPFHFIVTASGLTIADSWSGGEIFNGRRVKTVSNIFEKTASLPELAGADCYLFALVVIDEARAAFGLDYARPVP